jgi:Asp-tRNA(Asn)/Glu-tRNA(Gln) amidotransferase A subunit family amidase
MLHSDVPEDVDGMPCSVQVACTKLRDEDCLAVAQVVDQILHPRQDLQSYL